MIDYLHELGIISKRHNYCTLLMKLGGVLFYTRLRLCIRSTTEKTAGTIWGEDTYGQFCFLFIFAIWPIFWPPGGHLDNQTFAIFEPTVVEDRQIFMVGVSDEATLHITQVFDLTYFSRSQRSKFIKNDEVVMFCHYLVYNVVTLCRHVYRCSLPYPWILVRSGIKYGRQVAILKIQLSTITPKLTTRYYTNFV
jgi:hypothetical protein